MDVVRHGSLPTSLWFCGGPGLFRATVQSLQAVFDELSRVQLVMSSRGVGDKFYTAHAAKGVLKMQAVTLQANDLNQCYAKLHSQCEFMPWVCVDPKLAWLLFLLLSGRRSRKGLLNRETESEPHACPTSITGSRARAMTSGS